MNYTLAIFGAPQSSQAPLTALNFARALLARGHQIHRLFFYLDGVYNASSLTAPPQDEIDLPAEWQTLIDEYQLDAVVWIAAAVRRGLLNENEANRYDKSGHNLREGFDLSGLGQWVDAISQSDRLISFGA